MNEEYLSEIVNSRMEGRLLRVDNVPILEDLLNRESRRLERLQKLKEDDKLDFGDKVSSRELKELFPQICSEVDGFLGIQDGEVPKFGYFSLFKPGIVSGVILLNYTLAVSLISTCLISLVKESQSINPFIFLYNIFLGTMNSLVGSYMHSFAVNPGYKPLFRNVNLKKEPRANLISSAGHEYTHFVQHRIGIPMSSTILSRKDTSIFLEGHARSVEKNLSEIYREREDNEAFLYPILDKTIGEFKSAYFWVCKKLGQKPRESLLKTRTSGDSDENFNMSLHRRPTSHAIGNALFSIYEALQGQGIYRDMIHGDFRFT